MLAYLTTKRTTILSTAHEQAGIEGRVGMDVMIQHARSTHTHVKNVGRVWPGMKTKVHSVWIGKIF